ncbi:hypothetical protein TCAL_03517 [Tigriopus californicus]|uniref:Glutathione S-transferase 3, mitochondrial n=1 Tax=Tigriopus californicus TaxID=6832 RepID=A0A553PEP6_TIGCA|nr:hypothetical protein TCAL_03517 [Tigriopus californicus]
MPVLQLTHEFGYVALVASSTFLLNMWQSIRIGGMRKKLDVKYPVMYSEKHPIFNCYQRAHQNTLEQLPFFLTTLFLAGIRFPCYAAMFGASWLLGRVVYTLGYSSGSPDKRVPGAFISMILGQFPLFVMSDTPFFFNTDDFKQLITGLVTGQTRATITEFGEAQARFVADAAISRTAAVSAVTGLNATNAASAVPGVAGVLQSFKMPTLWEAQSRTWFAQLESGFKDAQPRIFSDAAKYAKLRGLWPPHTEGRIITKCSATISADSSGCQDRYETFKVFDLSGSQKHLQLFSVKAKEDKSFEALNNHLLSLEADPKEFRKAYFIHTFIPNDMAPFLPLAGILRARAGILAVAVAAPPAFEHNSEDDPD